MQRYLQIAGWVLLVLLGGLAVVRWGGLDRITPLVQAMALVPYLAVLCVVIAVFLFVTHRRRLAIAAAVLAVAFLGAIAPRWGVTPHAAPKGSRLRVMTANLYFGAVDPADLVHRIAEQQPDLLSLQDLTPQEADKLDRAGIGAVLPYRVLRTAPSPGGTGLYARTPLSNGGRFDPRTTFDLARAELDTGSVPLDVIAVHTRPPTPGSATTQWGRELSWLPGAGAGGRHLLVGDFNATMDHGAFRRLVDTGYHDAAASVGAGLKPTFRTWWVPPIAIDHVLMDKGLTATAIHTYPLRGSDHSALVADLVVAPAA